MHPNIRYGTDGNASLIEDVSCSIRSYLTLLQCNVYDTYSTDCSNHNLDLVINCCEYYVKESTCVNLPFGNIQGEREL